jgi:hypothetical protein
MLLVALLIVDHVEPSDRPPEQYILRSRHVPGRRSLQRDWGSVGTGKGELVKEVGATVTAKIADADKIGPTVG